MPVFTPDQFSLNYLIKQDFIFLFEGGKSIFLDLSLFFKYSRIRRELSIPSTETGIPSYAECFLSKRVVLSKQIQFSMFLGLCRIFSV